MTRRLTPFWEKREGRSAVGPWREPSEAREWKLHPSYAKASAGILPSLRERRMVGSEGIEPPTLSV